MLVGGTFFGYVTVLFSGERPRSSQAGSTVIRVFDVGLNSSSYVPSIFFPNPHIIFQSPEAILQLD